MDHTHERRISPSDETNGGGTPGSPINRATMTSYSTIVAGAILFLQRLWAYPSAFFDSNVPYATKATRRLGVRIAIALSIVVAIVTAVLKGWLTRVIGHRRSTKTLARNERVVEIRKLTDADHFDDNDDAERSKISTPPPRSIDPPISVHNGILMSDASSTPLPNRKVTIAFSESPASHTDEYNRIPPPRSVDAFLSSSSPSEAPTLSPASPSNHSQTHQPMQRENTQPPPQLEASDVKRNEHSAVLADSGVSTKAASALKPSSRSGSNHKGERRITFSNSPTPPAPPTPLPALPSPILSSEKDEIVGSVNNDSTAQKDEDNDEVEEEPMVTLNTKKVVNRFGALASKVSADMNSTFGEAKPARTSSRNSEGSASRRERKAAEKESAAKDSSSSYSNRESLLALKPNCPFSEFRDALKKQPSQPVMALPDFIMLVGIPGSGKTRWANEYIDRMSNGGSKKKYVLVSSDAVREQITGHVDNQSQNTLVWEVVLGICQGLLRSGTSVILDGTNVDTEKRRRFLKRMIMGDKLKLEIEGPQTSSASSTPTQAAAIATSFPSHPIGRSNGTLRSGTSTDSKKSTSSASDDDTKISGGPSTPILQNGNSTAPLPSVPTSVMLETAEAILRQYNSSTEQITAHQTNRTQQSSDETEEAPLSPTHNPIDCNRLLKLLTTSKIICKKRIRDDLKVGLLRSNVPESVIDLMATRLQEAGSALQEERWIAMA